MCFHFLHLDVLTTTPPPTTTTINAFQGTVSHMSCRVLTPSHYFLHFSCVLLCLCIYVYVRVRECKYATDACYCPWDKKRQREEGKVQGLVWRRAGCPYKISMQIVDSVALRRLAVIVTCQVVLVKSFSVTRLIFHRRDSFWSKNLIRISACPCLRLRLNILGLP